MTRGRTITRLVVAALSAVTVLGCSRQSAVAPAVVADSSDPDAAAAATPVTASAQSTPGTYDLGFFVNGPGGFTPVTTLPVLSNELILGGHVTNGAGTPATRGSVTFQY